VISHFSKCSCTCDIHRTVYRDIFL